jgi:hypothetical protein
MASKLKTTQLKRKEQYERKLKTRLALLAERKTDPSKINKDPLVKNLRANIEATDARLKAIAKIEQRTAELAKIKAEKAEAAKAEKAGAPGKPAEGGKEKGKEKGKDKGKDKESKKTPEEGKEKKKKKEKSEADAT